MNERMHVLALRDFMDRPDGWGREQGRGVYVELTRRYRGAKGICLVDLTDADMIENIDAAAARKGEPLLLWQGKSARVLGAQPTQGCREAFDFALERPQARAAEFAQTKKNMTIANASMKFKQLWEQGFLLRRESAADTGGVEFVYQRIA
jgi:hypothetical protein